jgi:hypothetical protein
VRRLLRLETSLGETEFREMSLHGRLDVVAFANRFGAGERGESYDAENRDEEYLFEIHFCFSFEASYLGMQDFANLSPNENGAREFNRRPDFSVLARIGVFPGSIL